MMYGILRGTRVYICHVPCLNFDCFVRASVRLSPVFAAVLCGRHIPLYTANFRNSYQSGLHQSTFELLEVRAMKEFRNFVRVSRGVEGVCSTAGVMRCCALSPPIFFGEGRCESVAVLIELLEHVLQGHVLDGVNVPFSHLLVALCPPSSLSLE